MQVQAFIQSVTDLLPVWSVTPLATLLIVLVLIVIKRIILAQIRHLINKTPYKADSLLICSIETPASIAIIGLGVLLYSVIEQEYTHSQGWISLHATQISQLFLIISLVIFANQFITGLLCNYAERSNTLRNSRSIIQGISSGVIFGVGALVLLGTVGISITPLIASLGITSLAVALALRPTLENFFSGVQLVADKPIRVGDYIEIDSGEQGFVEKIGWRSTWIKMLPNNTVIMPNSVLAQSKIINYYYPEKELSVPVELGVHYSSDLDQVEKVTLEVARKVLKEHEWGVSNYDTFVVFTGFGDSSINFTVMLRAKEYFNRFWVKSAFIKALHKRFAEEGINIPFPIRAINLDQENAAQHLKAKLD